MKYSVHALGFCLGATFGSARADVTADIAAQNARIDGLLKDVAPLIAPLQVSKADVRVFASFTPLATAIAGLNSLPATQRTVVLQSTAANGQLYSDNGLCNSYVELQGPRDLHAEGALSNFNASIQNDGSVVFSAHAQVAGHAQLHWQFKGKRGLFNACPPGGGFGGSIGANATKDLDLQIQIGFALAPGGQAVSYSAVIVQPRQVNVTVSLGIQYLGNIGFPVAFNVPGGALATGQFPLLIANGGKLVIPGTSGPREYAFALKPTSFTANKVGVALEWNSIVDFKTAAIAPLSPSR
ncbi:hypothetical protein QN397_19685 [Variovorax sp. RTB1]|uniref:hypothetical protein n=1 Tax=Variovorax sp. RTB1 TaxID=3048631 RepID=UPI002B2365E9|nr:hypothetical protein [Variovorax sp. RTB1]MEB0113533.1 hypothetical protein [Variovorax sp. RTB1]